MTVDPAASKHRAEHDGSRVTGGHPGRGDRGEDDAEQRHERDRREGEHDRPEDRAEEEARAAHVADDRVPVLERAQVLDDLVAVRLLLLLEEGLHGGTGIPHAPSEILQFGL